VHSPAFDEDDGIEVVWVEAVLGKHLAGRVRLQRGKAEPASRIVANDVLDRAVAEVADAIEEYDRVTRAHDSMLRLSTRLDTSR
jgi:hypothetical protein